MGEAVQRGEDVAVGKPGGEAGSKGRLYVARGSPQALVVALLASPHSSKTGRAGTGTDWGVGDPGLRPEELGS